MEWKPEELKPAGSHILVRRAARPTEKGGISIPDTAVSRQPCKKCLGMGCFPSPVYEEDGLKINHWDEAPCRDCSGRGYGGTLYDLQETFRDFEAEVVAVGPGAYKVKKRMSDGKVMRVYGHRVHMPVKAGDRVLIARYAGYSGVSWYLDDEWMMILPYEIIALVE